MTIELTLIDVIIFIILTSMFTFLEIFVKEETKLNKILKLIPIMMFPSAILIIVWNLLCTL